MSGSSPEQIHVTRARDVSSTDTGQTDGMIRQSAIVELIPNQQLVGVLMRAQPHASSTIHHHGSQDTILYAVSGRGAVVWDHGKQRDNLEPGDWALIPHGREHQEVNDGDEEWVAVICRAPGGTPENVHLTGWGGEEVKG